jgi:hypothetical protein
VTFSVPLKSFELNADMHDPLILLKIRDEHDGEFDFSCTPSDARHWGERLKAWADKIDARPKKQSH